MAPCYFCVLYECCCSDGPLTAQSLVTSRFRPFLALRLLCLDSFGFGVFWGFAVCLFFEEHAHTTIIHVSVWSAAPVPGLHRHTPLSEKVSIGSSVLGTPRRTCTRTPGPRLSEMHHAVRKTQAINRQFRYGRHLASHMIAEVTFSQAGGRAGGLPDSNPGVNVHEHSGPDRPSSASPPLACFHPRLPLQRAPSSVCRCPLTFLHSFITQ